MQSRVKFDTFVDKGTLVHNYAHIFDLLSRLRQAVDHPYLLVHGSLARKSGELIPTTSRKDADVCALCQDDIEGDPDEKALAQCGHAFHRDCLTDYLEVAPSELPLGGVGCPQCYQPLTVQYGGGGDEEDAPVVEKKSTRKSILSSISTSDFKSSTKMEALVDEVKKMMESDPTAKGIVFSQFVSMLELCEFRLKREGIQCVKLLGGQSMLSRSNIILSFNSDPSLRIILISLKAGGEGLNLQVANRVFLMDPWWNPAGEQQAIQRAHRIGQTKPVHAVRFIADDTVEEKIVMLQEKKQLIFDGTVGANNNSLVKLNGEDLKFLFS